jgi:hypothetical protein
MSSQPEADKISIAAEAGARAARERDVTVGKFSIRLRFCNSRHLWVVDLNLLFLLLIESFDA